MTLKRKIICFTGAAVICAMMMLMMPAVKVLADNELLITFQVDIGETSFPIIISIEFTNKSTGRTVPVECNYENDYQWKMALEEGEYTLTSYKVTTSGGGSGIPQELDYVVEFDDFRVSLNEGDKTVTGFTMDRRTYEALYGREEREEEPDETSRDLSWIHDGTTDHNVANPQEATNEIDIAYYTIPQDNEYFPGWTVIEIQEWYKQEVNNYLATEYAQDYILRHGNRFDDEKDYEEYIYEKVAIFAAEDITYYPSEEYGPREPGQCQKGLNGLTIINYGSYSTLVSIFQSNEECAEFYEANKMLLNFILEYYWETGVQLNFNIWDYDDLPVMAVFQETSSPENREEEGTASDFQTSAAVDSGSIEIVETTQQPEKESGTAGYIMAGTICVVLVCGVCTGIYFYRKKTGN